MIAASVAVTAQASFPPQAAPEAPVDVIAQLWEATLRLPLAAALGAALALRPRRRGTPARSMSVIETQIVLAVVGALIMLVVGASLARAFGIVGAANLIRYRAKIDDPKDAVVMLAALAVGLASGVGLYLLATFGTIFVGVVLWIIESFEPRVRKEFELHLRSKGGMQELRPKIESVLGRFHVKQELRASAEDHLTYEVSTPEDTRLDRVSQALTGLQPEGEIAVEWDDRKAMKKPA
ncbi:MAG TPA: MgtC/SapB family protein [Vicinamibacterales bacterium]|nr:MgtC/SapB family protein [Vicinamibacterales bacterium]